MKTLSDAKVEGTYEIRVQTPMGIEKGTMKLLVEDGILCGSLNSRKETAEFHGGTISNNEIQFEAKIKTPMGRLRAKVTGEIEKDRFTGIAKLPLGSAKIDGNRIG
jgi:hypothetical protein